MEREQFSYTFFSTLLFIIIIFLILFLNSHLCLGRFVFFLCFCFVFCEGFYVVLGLLFLIVWVFGGCIFVYCCNDIGDTGF